MSGQIVTRNAPERVHFPFEALIPIPEQARDAIAREALRVNARYLDEFLEEYSFCPYSRAGRKRGQVHQYTHYCDSLDAEALVALMRDVASDAQQVVVQVIFPAIEVTPTDWVTFSHELTAYGHAKMGGSPVLACAPLHPALPYSTGNPEAMIPLFRRTPDPTIQWVRLDGLESIYAGRGSDTVFVNPREIEVYLSTTSTKPNLYERIAATNAAMARRLKFEVIEALLSEIATDARKSYERILLDA